LLDRRANSFTDRDLASIFTNERETLMGDCDQLRKRTPEKAGDGSIAPAAELSLAPSLLHRPVNSLHSVEFSTDRGAPFRLTSKMEDVINIIVL
jgi:hypothetical protein